MQTLIYHLSLISPLTTLVEVLCNQANSQADASLVRQERQTITTHIGTTPCHHRGSMGPSSVHGSWPQKTQPSCMMTSAEPLEKPLITSNKIKNRSKTLSSLKNWCRVTGWPKNFSKKPSWSTLVKDLCNAHFQFRPPVSAKPRKRVLESSHTAVIAEWPVWERFRTAFLFFHVKSFSSN